MLAAGATAGRGGGATGLSGWVAVGVAIAVLTAAPQALAVAASGPTGASASGAGTTALLQDDGPTAELSVRPNPAHPGETVTFDATGSTAGADGTITECQFDTDGDGTFERSTPNCILDRTYDGVGDFDVSVRVLTTTDRTATDSVPFAVQENDAPTAAIAIDPPRPRVGDPVELSGVESTDVDGDIVEYGWGIDGESVEGAVVETTFEAAGAYEVTLFVVDDDGASDTTGEVIEVADNRPPSADLAVEPAEPTVGDQVSLEADGSSDPEGAIEEYRWDVDGDDSVEYTTTGPETTITVESAGERRVAVTVVDDRDATATAAVTVPVVAPTRTDVPTEPATATAGEPTADGPDESTTAGSGDGTGGGPVDAGLFPMVPDWIALLVLSGVAGVALAHRREPIPDRVRELRERIHEGEFRRNLAKKGTGFVAKTAFKKSFRRLADGVEASGRAVGGALESVGRAIKRGSKRVADVLRAIGG